MLYRLESPKVAMDERGVGGSPDNTHLRIRLTPCIVFPAHKIRTMLMVSGSLRAAEEKRQLWSTTAEHFKAP
jgi:hypothetical protein